MSPILRPASIVAIAAVLTSCALAATTTAPTVKAEDLPRVPPTELKDVLKTFRMRPGFHIELAAGEPNVVDPIAMSFDANGRLFVIGGHTVFAGGGGHALDSPLNEVFEFAGAGRTN